MSGSDQILGTAARIPGALRSIESRDQWKAVW